MGTGSHPEELTREELLKIISKSASFGNLGAFIGAGFSKAVLNDDFEEIALSWGELLEQASHKLGIDYDHIWKEGVSYPEIASKICQQHSENNYISYEESLRKLKRHIADLTSWYPDKEKRASFSGYLNKLLPKWIITTNYDLVIESLLTGVAVPLGPNDPLVAPTKLIPVFHLHGIRTSPEEIIIAQEDYVGLFRPTQYRQIKLALMIKESTMLILGYGLGDVNVLTALDWSKNVFKNESLASYPNQIIQVIKKEKPKKEPYKDRNSIMVLETESLESFFQEYIQIRKEQLKKEEELERDLMSLSRELDTAKSSMVDKFIDDEKYRKQALRVLSRFSNDLIAGFISFLNTCIDATWERSAPKGAFQGYADNLNMILDILTAFTFKQMPPALFETLAYSLHRVGGYVGNTPGQSFAANHIWQTRKTELPDEMSTELSNFSEQHGYGALKRLTSQI